MTFKARIRGVYSTALTKLLLDNGFKVVQPSLPIRNRFKLEENMESPDIDIYDRHSRQGIHAEGTTESLSAFKTILHRYLIDVVTRMQLFPMDGIYKGKVKGDKRAERLYTVDLGSTIGKLPKREAKLDSTNTAMVQVQREQTSTREAWLSTKISILGEHAVLIPERKIKVSLKIYDMQERTRLIELGSKIAPLNWGIIWRTTAAHQTPEVLEKEISHLVKICDEIFRKSEETTAPALLWGSKYYMNVEFPALSKASLDEIRAQITSTLKRHHYYKTCGRAVSAALEMAEKMLARGVLDTEVEDLFHEIIETEFPTEGSFVGIEHVKPDGRIFYLGKAHIEKINGNELRYSRVFKKEGFYDSLDIPKKLGDRAVTEAKIGGWYYTTRYFSQNGVYKGALINFHTPLEVYQRWIRYVDLEVDICVLPDGNVKVVDDEKLGDVVAADYISERLAIMMRKKVSEILETIDAVSSY